MPRIIWGIIVVFLLVPVHNIQAQGEIVFSIAGKPCYKTELEQLMIKTGASDKIEALNTVIDFKLKVHHAKELGIDTTKVFRLKMESLWQEMLSDAQKKLSTSQMPIVDYTLYTIRMQQHGSKLSAFDCGRIMNDVFTSLEKGVSDNELGAIFPLLERQERTAFTLDELMPDVEVQLRQLNVEEFSHPFLSALGMHIVRKHGLKEGDSNMIVESTSPSLLQQKKDAEDALLVKMVVNKLAGNLNEPVDEEILDFFTRNKKRYEWSTPRFYGIVIHGISKKVLKKAKKSLSGKQNNSLEELVGLLKTNFKDLIIVDSGLFELGNNAVVDKLVFKKGKGVKQIDYPYSAVVGAKLNPEDVKLSEVKDKVVRDCKRAKELDVFMGIRALYDVEINQEVLKSVNYAIIK